MSISEQQFRVAQYRRGAIIQYGGSSDGWNFHRRSYRRSVVRRRHCGQRQRVSITPTPWTVLRQPLFRGGEHFRKTSTFAQAGDYSISFLAAYRDYYNGSNPIAILIDGVNVCTITPTSTDYQLYQTNPVSISAGPHLVTFAGLTTGGPIGHRSSIRWLSPPLTPSASATSIRPAPTR